MKFRHRLEKIMIADYPRLNRELDRFIQSIRTADPSVRQKKLLDLTHKFEISEKRVQRRGQSVKPLLFDPALPICAKRGEIIEAIRRRQVVIIAGETGSGKTTQIPKMCLDAGLGLRGVIALTQPRRIAAVSIAMRIASELGETCGHAVGYKIRFEEKSSKDSLIQVMTDGILLTEIVHDRELRRYDTIIIDEAHERSLNIDFLLGYLRTLVRARPDLKVLITSATIDTAKFSQAFDNAPIIEVSGRMYPVDVRWHPVDEKDEEKDETGYVEAAVTCVEKLQRERRYEDILIFLPTERDIRDACLKLEKRCSGLVLPLYAKLSGNAQRMVFAPADKQKIIVATNIAETSLTIPGIKYVIDSGLVRMLEYNPRSQTTGLPVKPVSQSSAEQRKGRCGRVRDGICIRLYAQEDYLGRPRYTQPEILRSNLAGVILRMLSLNLGSIASFPFIDRPQPKSIRDGLDILRELGAITRDESAEESDVFRLTPVGHAMAALPVDPRVSRMLLEAGKSDCVRAISVIAAALSIQDPRERPFEKIDRAAAAHAVFQNTESDFIGFINLWNRFHEVMKRTPSQNALRKFCRDAFLSYRRMMEWRDIYFQITHIIDESPHPATHRNDNMLIDMDQEHYDRIHRCILSGYLSNIAFKKEKNLYTAAKSREVMLYPGSALFNRGGSWIVAAEISQTSRVFARHAANIKSEWLEELGREHCRYTYAAAHWEKSRGQVVALEKVTLFGLTIVEQRSVSYDRISPEGARQIFIREALVTGEVARRLPFLEHNLRLWEQAKILEDKLRTRGFAADEDMVARLYDQKLPMVSDLRELAKIIRDRGSDDFLRFGEKDFIEQEPDRDTLSKYPDQIKIDSALFPIRYRFAPGQADDGVTVKIPVGLVSRAADMNIEGKLPSLLEEKVAQLIKMLPKTLRQKMPPGKIVAKAFCRGNAIGQNALRVSLSAFVLKEFKVAVPPEAWLADQLPAHLNLLYSVVDEQGNTLKESRDVISLQQTLSNQTYGLAIERIAKQWEKAGLTRWDFGDLPENIPMTGKQGLIGYAYPALKDEESSVAVRIFADEREAASFHVSGVAALYNLHFEDKIRQLKKNIKLTGKMRECTEMIGPPKRLEEAILKRIRIDLFERKWRRQEDFLADLDQTGMRILPYCQMILDRVAPVCQQCAAMIADVQTLIARNRSNRPVSSFLKDTIVEACRLVPIDFPERYTQDRMLELPRYLKALTIRAQRGSLNLTAASVKLNEIETYTRRFHEIQATVTPMTSQDKSNKIDELFWLIEEYKVSLFAQELKTPIRVSAKIIQAYIDDVLNMI
ncbi:MAG: ATP-dependent RNA helicase HrpA [Smithellaceae bacterium]